MTKRVVLAYSGGLDTSVAVRVDRARSGAPRSSRCAVDVGQLADDDWDAIRERGARRRRGRGRGRRRARRVRRRLPRARASTPTRSTRASTRSSPRFAPGHRRAPRRARPASSAPTRSRTAAPGKGNDQVRFEVSVARARARPRGARAGPRVGLHPRTTASSYAAKHDIPINVDARRARTRSTRTCGAARSSAACSRTRGCRRRRTSYALTRDAADAPHGAPRARRAASSGACRWRSTGSAMPLHELIAELGDAVGRVRLGPHRHGREPPGRHQEPGDLRVPGRRSRCSSRTPTSRRSPSSATSMREKAAARAAVRRAGLRRPLALAAEEALDAFMAHTAAATSPARCGCGSSPAAASSAGRRADTGLYDYDLATYDADDTFRHEDSAGFVRLWGLSVETWSRAAGRPPGRPESSRAGRRPSTGRPLWHGRFAEGPADELLAFTVSLPFDRRLAADDLAGSRAHVAHARRASGCSPTTRRAGVSPRSTGSRTELADGHVRVRADRRGHPHRDRAAGHRDRRVAPAPSSTPAAAATTRSRLDLRLFVRREGARTSPTRSHELQEVLLDRARRRRRRLPPRLHAPAARAAGAARAPPARALLGARARRRPLARRARRGPTCRRSARARSPARACRSIPTASPPTSASRAGSRTRSTRCPTATSSPRRCSSPRSRRCTCRASARRSCCGRARSSGSCASPTRTAPARRCCRRRRTPTSPSSRAARPAA